MSQTRPSARLPSALSALDTIVGALGATPAVFCDYDGTLTEIVEDPRQAVLSSETRSILRRLAGCCPVGIVSGRDLRDVRALVGLGGVFYLGGHGYEIESPGGETFEPGGVEASLAELEGARSELEAGTENLEGVSIEGKKFAVTVHTRRAKGEDDRRAAAALALRVSKRFPSLTLIAGKEVWELRPGLDWHKGKGVRHVVQQLLPRAPSAVVYLGDDRTDEDAFRYVGEAGGITIVVGDQEATSATHRLADPSEVRAFLAGVARSVC